MIIALSGYAQSGKDTVADYLVEEHGFEKLGMNGLIREACEALNPIIHWDRDDGYFTYKQAMEEYGYEFSKKRLLDFRPFMQRLGTEFAEALGHPEMWIRLLLERCYPEKDYVMPSCRRWVEAQEIVNHSTPGMPYTNGYIVRVNRPGCVPANDHPSEVELDSWPFDYVIDNDKSIGDLGVQAEIAYAVCCLTRPDRSQLSPTGER
jgi:hypothetical protein